MEGLVRELTLEAFRESYDWEEIFDQFVNPVTPVLGDTVVGIGKISRGDVRDIIALVEGEGDGPDWVGLFKLKDKRYVTVTAGCDYTGWDCQAGGKAQVASTLKKAVRFGLSDDERDRLGIDSTTMRPKGVR